MSQQGAIRIERDPAWWLPILSAPGVTETLHGANPGSIAELAANPIVLPIAAEHGGYFFTALDSFGLVRELHSAFTSEGRGREAHDAGVAALELVFATARIVTTIQTENPLSQPPRSFGFLPSGDWSQTVIGPVRSWYLSHAAWLASPTRRRRCPSPFPS